MKLLSLYTGSKARQLGVFLAVLYLPTVVTNGAYWAQCDSIYAFFGIFALYLGLSEKGVGAMISLAACLAFKLQAVFIIPVFFVLLLAKKLRWTQLSSSLPRISFSCCPPSLPERRCGIR